jgi:hypothetical protein
LESTRERAEKGERGVELAARARFPRKEASMQIKETTTSLKASVQYRFLRVIQQIVGAEIKEFDNMIFEAVWHAFQTSHTIDLTQKSRQQFSTNF